MLWTINVDEIYRQQANIIDLYLLKISVNSVVYFYSYGGTCKCCVRILQKSYIEIVAIEFS